MKIKQLFTLGVIASVSAAIFTTSCSRNVEPSTEGALTQIPFHQVTLEDDFWLPRLQTQKRTLVPFALGKTEPAVEQLRITAGYLKGDRSRKLMNLPYYVASDLFKVIEGAAYLLAIEPDEELEKQMDEIIDIIAEAQCEDGYLYEYHIFDDTMRERNRKWGPGEDRYKFVVHSHELYNMGHMYEGAVAYHHATGKRKWLDVAEKSARHINKVFFEGDENYNDGKPINQAPGHQEMELALVKLFKATNDSLYLDMAKRFIDIRGVTYRPEGEGVMSPEYAQQHLPVREQREAVGHSVRATYLYSGMADVAGLTSDATLMPALEAIWHDIVDRKMHITGGLGAVPGIEGFGPAYMLPNKITYNETCSAVGNVLFNYRMFLASRDAKYVDVAEVALYNNVLAGVNLEGNKFFYVNVLETDGVRTFNHGHKGRSPWFNTACCPSNLARLIPQVSSMIYSHSGNDIYCALYAASAVEVPLESGKVNLTQRGDYPFSDKVEIEVAPSAESANFTLWLRLPTWCVGKSFVPGELYSYADNVSERVTVEVNGKKISPAKAVKGFLPVQREWKAGDKLTLTLPMPVRYSVADERVEADINRLCITRGPFVYCAEEVDNSHLVTDYYVENISQKAEVKSFTEGIMNGIAAITIPADVVCDEQTEAAALTLVPYYAWDNRGDKAMNVWFARSAQTVRDSKPHPVGNIASIATTHTNSSDDIYAVADGEIPSSSADVTISRWTSWSQLGKVQQLELTLKQAQPIESVSVYWYNDNGGVKLPESWSMEYHKDGKWMEYQAYVTDTFGTLADQFNVVHPASPIEADALRLTITPKADASVGILEIQIE